MYSFRYQAHSSNGGIEIGILRFNQLWSQEYNLATEQSFENLNKRNLPPVIGLYVLEKFRSTGLRYD
jgi:hypothetical protein